MSWATEFVQAPDLQEMGSYLAAHLGRYVAETITGETILADRLAFENVVRAFLTRSRERGYDWSRDFPEIVDLWRAFVEQNVAGAADRHYDHGRREYERGRIEAAEALENGWTRSRVASDTRPASVGHQPARSMADGDGVETVLRLPPALHAGGGDSYRRAADGRQHALQAGSLATDAADALTHAPHAADGRPEDGARASLSPSLRITSCGKDPAAPAAADAMPFDTRAIVLAPASQPIPLSHALELFLLDMKDRKSDDRARADVGPICQFTIDLLGDVRLDRLTKGHLEALNRALPDIPDRNNIPAPERNSLIGRYRYAQAHGWKGLKRITITTLKDRYWSGLGRFFAWLIGEEYYKAKKPQFSAVSEDLLAPLPRDAFEDDEILKIVSLPLFTGCAGAARIWTPGSYFLQNDLYWAYLLLLLTGMRSGEVGQIRLDQFQTDSEYFYLDLRPFDPKAGRVAIRDLPQLKTTNAARVVPLHPLLVDLGLLERVAELAALGETRLFPDWKPYTKTTGEIRWGQPITKSYQYLKKLLKWERCDLALYGTRHLMAEWLDTSAVSQRTRNRVLGHWSPGVADGYGRKGKLDPQQAAIIAELEPPVIAKMRAVLMAAKTRAEAGNLAILKPWLSKAKLRNV
jgi:integrase